MKLNLEKGAHFIVNIVGLKAGWLACVLSAANDMPWVGALAVAVIALVHLWMSKRASSELKLLAVVALIGLSWDSVLVSTGLMQYPSGTFVTGLAPYWIVAMWVLFATALNVSLAWLKGRPWVAAAFGAIGGSMAFYGGSQLGGVYIPDLAAGLAAQAVGWAIILPTLSWLATQFDGVSHTEQLTIITESAVG